MLKMQNYLRLLVLLIIYTFSGSNFAQIGSVIGPNRSVEKQTVYRTKRIPQKKNTVNHSYDLNNLAQKITRNSRTEDEKAKAIFLWISTNISYDNELRNNSKLQKEFYTSEEKVIAKVLERRKALCGGYAMLYKKLCNQIGLYTEVINGFSKNYDPSSKNSKIPNHSWNAVKINGNWQLLDLTLAISYGTQNNPDLYWFKTDPKYFIKTHYPENLKWTLVRSPISRSEFESLP